VLASSKLQAIENRILRDIIIEIRRDKTDFTSFEHVAKTSSEQTIACLSELYQRLLREEPLPQTSEWQQEDAQHSASSAVGSVTEIGGSIDAGTVRIGAETAGVTSAPDHWRSPPTSPKGKTSILDTDVTHNPWQDEESSIPRNTKGTPIPLPGPAQSPPARTRESGFEHHHGRGSLSQIRSNGQNRDSQSSSAPSTQSGRPSSSMTSDSSPERQRQSLLTQIKSNDHAPVTQPISISASQGTRPSPNTTSNSSFERQRTNSLSQVNSNEITPVSSSPFSVPSPPGRADSSRRSSSFFDRFRRGSRSTPATGNGRDYLPAESNNYLGLCKSAWRMQVGQDVSAVTTGQRPTGGLYQSIRYIVCSQSGCRFEGRAVRGSHAHDAIDRTVIRFSDQVHFRWKFLMRNHVQTKSKDAVSFGCVLCSSPLIAAASGMLPIFDGERAFLEHIQEAHVGEGQWPEGHAKYRAGCVVSKGYPDDDTWDLLLLEWDGIASPKGVRPRGRNDSGLEVLAELDGRDMNEREELFVHELDGVGRMEIGDINGIGT